MSLRHQNNIACGKTVSCATKTDKNDIPAAGFTGKKTDTRFYQWVAGVFITTLLIVGGLWFSGLLDTPEIHLR